jgi:hypothetical protein
VLIAGCVYRWNLRLASLIAPTLLPPIRTAGYTLLQHTFSTCTTSFLSQSKTTLAPALNILGSARSDPALYVAAMEVVKMVLVRSTWHADWAREVVGAAVVQRTVTALVAGANGDVPSVSLDSPFASRRLETDAYDQIKLPSIEAIVAILPLFPTPLRPLAASLHTLSVGLICDPSGSQQLIDAGSSLFACLYLLAPKGRDGLRDAWKMATEALTGSIDSLVPAVTSDIFAEGESGGHPIPSTY